MYVECKEGFALVYRHWYIAIFKESVYHVCLAHLSRRPVSELIANTTNALCPAVNIFKYIGNHWDIWSWNL